MNAAGEDSSQRKGNGECILVVDDQKSVLDMASIVFELGGYKIIAAANAFVAFETYEKQWNHIHAVLLDIGMPIMDGVELSRVLQGINPKVKIIVSSGKISEMHELELRNLGVEHFLPKPFNTSQLLKTIHDTIHDQADS